jgi:hypothetical protein
MSRFIALILLAVAFNSEVLLPTDEHEFKRLLILYIQSTDMAWNADGTRIATALSGTVRMWDAETLQQRYYVRHGQELNGIQFNSAGVPIRATSWWKIFERTQRASGMFAQAKRR